jgi:putative transposase
MNKIDELNTKYPFYGYPRITEDLIRKGYFVNEKRIYRLMKKMGIMAIYPKKNLSRNNTDSYRYPYLLKNLDICKSNQVWGSDITYIKMQGGFMYLYAIIDWHSRYVVSWELSNTLEVDFCIRAYKKALLTSKPEISNTDQGSHFTSKEYINLMTANEIQISMDGKGRCFDNIFTERLWRSLKYEEIYLKDYENGKEAKENIENYFEFYNNERLHQSLGYKTPAEIYLMSN